MTNIKRVFLTIFYLGYSIVIFPMKTSGTVCLSVASRTNTYGISFNISPYRKIDGKMYQKYKYDEQCQILLNIFCDEQMNVIGETTDDYVFEKTERGNAHLHAMITTNLSNVKVMQKAIDDKYGYPKDPIDRVFHYSGTTLHRSFWDKYMSKDQQKDDQEEVLTPDSIPRRPLKALFDY